MTFARSLPNDSSFEPRNGSAAAPMNTLGGVSTVSPPRSVPLSRRFRTISIISSVFRSKTPFASRSFPAEGGSPQRHSTFRTPRAAAPRRSAWSAIRFRSRTTICMTGSTPSWSTIAAAAREEICTRARVQSVTLHASTDPRYRAAFCRISVASADAGGAISAVTANAPEAKTRSRRLPERIARTPTASAIGATEDGGRYLCFARP